MAREVSLTFYAGSEPENALPGCVRAESPEDLPAVFDSGEELHRERLTEAGGLHGCLACGDVELYTQKDFPRWIGITIVVVAALLAPFTYYLSLAAAALVDWVLYRVAPEVVLCYGCKAEHRGFAADPKHPRFDREIEERRLYGKKAVMGKPMREGGTADAPEPEH